MNFNAGLVLEKIGFFESNAELITEAVRDLVLPNGTNMVNGKVVFGNESVTLSAKVALDYIYDAYHSIEEIYDTETGRNLPWDFVKDEYWLIVSDTDQVTF